MPAALLMANLQATVRGCARSSTSVADCVATVNRLLVGSTDAKTFVTLFYSVYDAQARTLTYCNAGHNPPYRSTVDGRMVTLDTGGPIVAAFGWSKYEQETIQLAPGERLVVFTDGVTEAANPADEQFGEPRLEEILKQNAQAKAADTIQHVLDAVLKFQAEAPVADDITLVCLRT
ncbi:MAG: serine/threonine-protein phosphatase [candidate division Zixibacteria bacterium]|nr:serine/threonine-protein phosphatase [candidate division Zixibacteria bacterium]